MVGADESAELWWPLKRKVFGVEVTFSVNLHWTAAVRKFDASASPPLKTKTMRIRFLRCLLACIAERESKQK